LHVIKSCSIPIDDNQPREIFIGFVNIIRIGGFSMTKPAVLAIDIGGSKYIVGLVSEKGEIYAKKRYTCFEKTGNELVTSIIAAAQELLEKNENYTPKVIGVTIPGLADPKRGYWIEASFSGIRDIPLGSILSRQFGIPAYADNDGQACALAERLFGVCQNVSDFLYLTVSNGVGGGIFLKDRIYYGATGCAGEMGHVTVVEHGRRCKCGKRGCLEMYAAGGGIVKNYIELGGNRLIHGKITDARTIAALAEEGDLIALETFRLEGYYLGKAIAGACNLLNPAMIVIGGGVSLSFPLFEKTLWEYIRRSIYLRANEDLKIKASPFGNDGGLMGATAVALCGLNKMYGWGEL
jgi:glucokinase